jgi:hypothetical protein
MAASDWRWKIQWTIVVLSMVVGFLLNIILSFAVPALFPAAAPPSFWGNIVAMFKHHRHTLVESSSIVAVAVGASVAAAGPIAFLIFREHA